MVNPKQGNKGQGGKRGMWIALAALVSAVLVAALGLVPLGPEQRPERFQI